MEYRLSTNETLLRQIEQANAIIDHIRRAGLGALNEYQQEKMLGLTVRQVMLLAAVQRLTRSERGHMGVSLNQLAREVHMSASAASHLVDTLVGHNILTRHSDEADRRGVRISLSESGRKCAIIARQGMLRAIERLTSGFTPEENAMRLNIIDRMHRAAYPDSEQSEPNFIQE